MLLFYRKMKKYEQSCFTFSNKFRIYEYEIEIVRNRTTKVIFEETSFISLFKERKSRKHILPKQIKMINP